MDTLLSIVEILIVIMLFGTYSKLNKLSDTADKIRDIIEKNLKNK